MHWLISDINFRRKTVMERLEKKRDDVEQKIKDELRSVEGLCFFSKYDIQWLNNSMLVPQHSI